MREDQFDVAYRLLDDELVDRDGRRCGRVDDVELSGEPGSPTEITAILSGPGAWAGRLPRPLRRASLRIFGDDEVVVPWDAVKDIAEVVELKERGEDLDLGRGEDAARRIVTRIPRS
jgi:sporulation protein YlmC with PRC-barrel domain